VVVKNESITYKEFLAYLLKKYVAFYLSRRLNYYLSDLYNIGNGDSFDKDFILSFLGDFITPDDIIIKNITANADALYKEVSFKQVIIETLLINTIKQTKGQNIFEISLKESNFFWNVPNEYIFSVLLEYVLHKAEDLKHINKGRLIFLIEPNENVNFKDLSILLNKAIRRKLPIVFFIWDNEQKNFSEVNSYLQSYGGFFNILSGYPQSKVFFKVVNNNDYLNLYKDIKSGALKSTENIPSVFLISAGDDGLSMSLNVFREWLLKGKWFKDIYLQDIERKLDSDVKSEINKSYFEKFLFDLCLHFSEKKESCSPDIGKDFLEKIMFLRKDNKFFSEYDFLKKYANNIGVEKVVLTDETRKKFKLLPVKSLDNKFKQVALVISYLFDNEFYMFENVFVNEFVYLYREMKDNIIFHPFPVSTILLKLSESYKKEDEFLSCVFEKINDRDSIITHNIYLI